jgi:hypothetical protein
MHTGPHAECSLNLLDSNKRIFTTHLRKNTQIPNFMNMCLVGAVLFHTEGRTDGRMQRHDVTNSRFPKFWECA